VAAIIWGSTLVLTQAAMRGFGPIQVVMLRFGLVFMLLLPLAWRRGFRLRDVIERDNLLLGLTGIALFYTLQNMGLAFTTAASGSLIFAGVPIATALLEAVLLRIRLNPRQWFGIGLTVVGTAVVSGTRQESGTSHMLLGNVLIVGAVLAWAVYTLRLRRVPAGADILRVTEASFGAGILFVLPLAAAETAVIGLPRPGLPALMALMYLSVIASGLTMWLWASGVQVIEASTATTFVNLVPLIGLALAMLAGDRITLWQACGGVLALAGVWVSVRGAVSSSYLEVTG